VAADAAHAPDHQSKAKIFISYSRKDMAFADRLETALKVRGFEPLIDRTDIYAFEDWWQRIQALIGRADTVVFVLSPDAVTSDVALKELAYGAALNKRFAPIVARRVEDAAVPEPLRRLNFIFLDDPDRFEVGADQLAEALTIDIGWVRQHTEFGEAARRWVLAGRSNGLLLRSPVLEEAERWIASRPRGAPEPTVETQALVADSRRGATRRRNILTASLAAGLVIALGLAGLAYWQRGIAVEQRALAEQQRRRAEDTLAAATKTANGLVFDLADRFQNKVGVPAALIKDILDRAINLQQQLIVSGQITPALEASEASASIQSAQALLKIGDTVGALKSADRARQIHERLLTANPSNIDWQDGLAVSQYWIGQVLRAEGKNSEALEAYNASLAITQKLADNAPTNPAWQYKLASDYEKMGDMLAALFRWDEALVAYKTNLAIRQRLSDIDQNNTDWQFALAVAYGRFGDLFLKQNSTRVNALPADGDRIAEALDAAQKGIAILKRLADGAPENALWTKELGIDYDLLADLLRVKGNIAEALEVIKKVWSSGSASPTVIRPTWIGRMGWLFPLRGLVARSPHRVKTLTRSMH
jgi:tetratricopeptide (TPR) repeat protein